MSRIILTRHNGEEDHIVVGWDRPCDSFFWQEFNPEPRNERGEVDWTLPEAEDWEEVSRFGGYMPREIPSMEVFLGSVPDDIRLFLTEVVQATLQLHKSGAVDPNTVVDLSDSDDMKHQLEIYNKASADK